MGEGETRRARASKNTLKKSPGVKAVAARKVAKQKVGGKGGMVAQDWFPG